NLPCNSGCSVSLLKHVSELTLKYSVSVTRFLFFVQLKCVFRFFSTTTAVSVLSRRVISFFKRLVIPENSFPEFTGNFCFWTSISCHFNCCFEASTELRS